MQDFYWNAHGFSLYLFYLYSFSPKKYRLCLMSHWQMCAYGFTSTTAQGIKQLGRTGFNLQKLSLKSYWCSLILKSVEV